MKAEQNNKRKADVDVGSEASKKRQKISENES